MFHIPRQTHVRQSVAANAAKYVEKGKLFDPEPNFQTQNAVVFATTPMKFSHGTTPRVITCWMVFVTPAILFPVNLYQSKYSEIIFTSHSVGLLCICEECKFKS